MPSAISSAQIDTHVREQLHAGSGLYTLDRELLASLEPDLIVTQELCAVCAVSYDLVSDAVKRLRIDTRVISLEPSSFDDVLSTIQTLGHITGHEMEAQMLRSRLDARITRLQAQIALLTRHPQPRMLLLEWSDPPMSAGHWTPDILQLAGATPVLANPGENSRVITWEEISASDPDVIVLSPCGFDLDATRNAARALEAQGSWHDLRAYHEREIYLLDGNAYVNRPGPRLVDTAEILATILFEDAIESPIVDPAAWEPLR